MKETGKELPDPKTLNAAIPENTWEKGLDGKPRPPWTKQYVCYLLSPVDAATLTFVNATAGARIAVERLEDKVRMMRTLRGSNVLPMVELASAPMPTQFGTKQRPEFKVVGWREIGGTRDKAALWLEDQSDKPKSDNVPGKKVEPPTLAEEMNDEIPI